MAFCPTCDETFPGGSKYCPKDGTLLVQREGDGAADADPMVGQIVAGRFRVVQRLGKGGMGTVYEAYQSATAQAELERH